METATLNSSLFVDMASWHQPTNSNAGETSHSHHAPLANGNAPPPSHSPHPHHHLLRYFTHGAGPHVGGVTSPSTAAASLSAPPPLLEPSQPQSQQQDLLPDVPFGIPLHRHHVRPSFVAAPSSSTAFPPFRIVQGRRTVRMSVDLPGVRPSDLTLQLRLRRRGVPSELILTATRHRPGLNGYEFDAGGEQNPSMPPHDRQRPRRTSVRRRFALDGSVLRLTKIKAQLVNGVLELVAPKRHQHCDPVLQHRLEPGDGEGNVAPTIE